MSEGDAAAKRTRSDRVVIVSPSINASADTGAQSIDASVGTLMELDERLGGAEALDDAANLATAEDRTKTAAGTANTAAGTESADLRAETPGSALGNLDTATAQYANAGAKDLGPPPMPPSSLPPSLPGLAPSKPALGDDNEKQDSANGASVPPPPIALASTDGKQAGNPKKKEKAKAATKDKKGKKGQKAIVVAKGKKGKKVKALPKEDEAALLGGLAGIIAGAVCALCPILSIYLSRVPVCTLPLFGSQPVKERKEV